MYPVEMTDAVSGCVARRARARARFTERRSSGRSLPTRTTPSEPLSIRPTELDVHSPAAAQGSGPARSTLWSAGDVRACPLAGAPLRGYLCQYNGQIGLWNKVPTTKNRYTSPRLFFLERPMSMDLAADESVRNAVRSVKDRLAALEALDSSEPPPPAPRDCRL